MTTPGSFTVGQTLTAADMNELGDWIAYTASLTNIAKGNATTWTSKYYKFNQIGFVSVEFVFGSTSSVSGDITIGLPSGWTAPNQVQGLARLTAAGTVYVARWEINAAGTGILVRANNAAGTYLQSTNCSATVPGTWTTNDTIRFLAVMELS
jgi:hypothetical protein